MKDLKELAKQYGLETIAVKVIGESDLRDAIVNFTTMQHAEDFAYKHGLLVDNFEKQSGKLGFYERAVIIRRTDLISSMHTERSTHASVKAMQNLFKKQTLMRC